MITPVWATPDEAMETFAVALGRKIRRHSALQEAKAAGGDGLAELAAADQADAHVQEVTAWMIAVYGIEQTDALVKQVHALTLFGAKVIKKIFEEER